MEVPVQYDCTSFFLPVPQLTTTRFVSGRYFNQQSITTCDTSKACARFGHWSQPLEAFVIFLSSESPPNWSPNCSYKNVKSGPRTMHKVKSRNCLLWPSWFYAFKISIGNCVHMLQIPWSKSSDRILSHLYVTHRFFRLQALNNEDRKTRFNFAHYNPGSNCRYLTPPR